MSHNFYQSRGNMANGSWNSWELAATVVVDKTGAWLTFVITCILMAKCLLGDFLSRVDCHDMKTKPHLPFFLTCHYHGVRVKLSY